MDCFYVEPPSAAIERLKEEREAHPSVPTRLPTTLPLKALSVEPEVFQVRTEGLQEDRINEIAEGLSGTSLDDPLHVWWSGLRWIIIEGHHRHAAYQLVAQRDGKSFKVPVIAHVDISLSQAMGMASRLNDRTKEKISKAEKQNMAWKLVVLEEGSIAKQAKAAGVSDSQISNMRKVRRALEERGVSKADMLNESWEEARVKANGKTCREFTPDVLEVMAHELAEELKMVRTTHIVKSPDILARALEIVSPELPSNLLSSDPFWNALNSTGREILKEIDEEISYQSITNEDF